MVDDDNVCWLRPRDAVALAGVSRKTLSKWAAAGHINSLVLPGSGLRRRRWYDRASLSACLVLDPTDQRPPPPAYTPPRQLQILLNVLTDEQQRDYLAVCEAEGLPSFLPE